MDLNTTEISEERGEYLYRYFLPGLQSYEVIEQSNKKYKKSGQQKTPGNSEMGVDRNPARRVYQKQNAQRRRIREHDRHATDARGRQFV
jgi:hypothetical protein